MPSNEKKFEQPFEGALTPGMIVLWFKGASEHAKPIPAIVMDGFQGGVADILLVDAGAEREQRKRSVYHKSSNSLRNSFGQVSDSAKAYGAWDFCPHTKEYDIHFMGEQDKAREKRQKEIEAERKRHAEAQAKAKLDAEAEAEVRLKKEAEKSGSGQPAAT